MTGDIAAESNAGESSGSGQASGLGGRYASALFDLAQEAGAIDKVRDELAQIGKALKESNDFAQFVRSPLYDREAQGKAMGALMEKAGASDLVRRFIGVVVANRRLFALPGIVSAYQALVARHRGEVSAEIVSAYPLNDDQTAKLKEKIRSIAGSDVALSQHVDPDLLGGFVVKIGSQMIDASIKTKLSRLQSILKEA